MEIKETFTWISI